MIKEQGYGDSIFFIIITLITIGTFSLFFNFMGNEWEKDKEKDLDKLTPLCSYECYKFDMAFYDLVKDGWLYHCWCIDDDKPYKIKTLESPRLN